VREQTLPPPPDTGAIVSARAILHLVGDAIEELAERPRLSRRHISRASVTELSSTKLMDALIAKVLPLRPFEMAEFVPLCTLSDATHCSTGFLSVEGA
jgi:hypothetical protein